MSNNTATATLVRGRSYTYKDVQFMKDEPKSVPMDLAEELENLVDEVLDSDGEQRGKPRFKVVYSETKAGQPKKIASVKTLGGTLQTSAKAKKPLGGGIKKRKV